MIRGIILYLPLRYSTYVQRRYRQWIIGLAPRRWEIVFGRYPFHKGK